MRRIALAAVAALVCIASMSAQQPTPSPIGPPIDPQQVQDQQDMTWADDHPIPGQNWADPTKTPARALKVALVAIDFEDQPFVMTLPKHSDPFGNPQIDPITREAVPQFYADFLNTPSGVNHGHTINGYWMEQSRGKVGIPKVDAFGPYRMPKKLFQYGLNEWNQNGGCPSTATCDGRMEPDADALWAADKGADIKSKYDIVIRIYAGYDETSVWQEFGEMKFASQNDIPAAWGNPDPSMPRWVITRYEPWTSWLAGAQQWGISSVRQGESSGTITHEIAHFAFRTGDNNNNPYVTPFRRVGSGPWDIMDRGSFNGPGGPHRRWVVPATEGASMPAGFMLRNRLRFEFVKKDQVLDVSRDGLAQTGLVVATIAARAAEPTAPSVAGMVVRLDGAAPQDRTPPCDMTLDPLCAGQAVFNNYTVEVVQRIGYDSFTPDNGVLIAKNKDGEGNSCGYNCFTWVIDAHPENINQVDFIRPGSGEKVMRTVADYRQLNDALFHAGTNSGSAAEWQDAANRLHFYVIDALHDPSGVLAYVVGVKSLDGSGPQVRGVAATLPATSTIASSQSAVPLVIRNAGAAGSTDIFRVAVSVSGTGWRGWLPNTLATAGAGDSTRLSIRVARDAGASATAVVTATVTSESDPTKRSVVKTTMKARD